MNYERESFLLKLGTAYANAAAFDQTAMTEDSKERVIAARESFVAAVEALSAPEQAEPTDAQMLEWLIRHVNGAALRSIGVITSGDIDLNRAAIRAAMKGQHD